MVNKLMIMLPLMYGVRKLDSSDPNIIFLLRAAYASVHIVIIAIVIYVYLTMQKAISTNTKKSKELIYVPPEVAPLAAAMAEATGDGVGDKGTTYKQVEYGKHAIGAARSLVSSTVMGICVTVGVHCYKGMVIGLAMQSIMGPLNLLENKLVSSILFSKKGDEDVRLFKEKKREELTDKDEVVDEEGNKIILQRITAATKKSNTKKTIEELLLDTWDMAHKADIGPLMSVLKKDNINFRTFESEWTPIMIMAAIGVKETKSAVLRMKKLGANPAITDKDGWNALHWASFHGSLDGVKVLLEEYGNLNLNDVSDKDGLSPLDHAKAESNHEIVKLLESITSESKQASGIKSRK